jgi:Holliday junction resolvase RusA-like endonuclease
MQISFYVPGKPQPGGSKRPFLIPGTKRINVTDANKHVGGWKQDVKVFAHQAYQGALLRGPLLVRCTFCIERPKGHYRTGKNSHLLKDSAPAYPLSKPDATKLFRSTEDALTGVIWKDDAQIVVQIIKKVYDGEPGAALVIESL